MPEYFDVFIENGVGTPITPGSQARPMGGSEYELLQLARELHQRGYTVCIRNQNGTTWEFGVEEVVGDRVGYRCRALIVSRYSTIPTDVGYDRAVVRATDMPGGIGTAEQSWGVHAHQRGKVDAFVTVSRWHASLFGGLTFGSATSVIHPMIDAVVYDLAKRPKNENKFIYASAAMKGLKETLEAWHDVHARLPEAELHVTTNWDDPPADILRHPGVVWKGRLSPQASQDLMADAFGLFYVNVFPETFCCVAAAADAAGCRLFIQADPKAGLAESVGGHRIFAYRASLIIAAATRSGVPDGTFGDFRPSTIMPQWLKVLRLENAHQTTVRGNSRSDSSGHLHIDRSLGRDREDEGRSHKVRDEASLDNLQLGESDERNRHGRPEGDGGGGGRSRQPYRPPYAKAVDKVEDQTVGENVDKKEASPPTKPEMTFVGMTGVFAPGSKRRPEICLVMIAKNEASVIPRAIASVNRTVDRGVVVVDQKNTDETFDLPIWGMGTRWKPIMAPTPFAGLAAARNEAVSRADRGDFVLMLDCDDTIEGELPPEGLDLAVDAYELTVRDGDLTYPRVVIFKPNMGFRYEGPAHEYLVIPEHARVEKLTTLFYRRGDGGHGAKNQYAKYMRDVGLFETELVKHPNDKRSMFYLAQSYKDAGSSTSDPAERDRLFKKSRATYEKRAKLGGWLEEVFVSWMNVADFLSQNPETEHLAPAYWILAAQTVPGRMTEAMTRLAAFFNHRKHHRLALISLEAPVPKTPPEGLFINTAPYLWEAKFQWALAASYLDDEGMLQLAIMTWEDLLKKAPAAQHAVIKNNIEFVRKR